MFGISSDGTPHVHANPNVYFFINPKGHTEVKSGGVHGEGLADQKRRPVRRKHIAPLLKDLEVALGIDLSVDGHSLKWPIIRPWKMVLVDRIPLAVELENQDGVRVVFLTLRVSFPTLREEICRN